MYQWNWQIIWLYREVFWQGAMVTLGLSVLVVFFGSLVGFVLAMAKRSGDWILVWPACLYIELFRSLPILVVLIWIYYVLPILFNLTISAFICAVIALSLHLSAFVAETVRAGIEDIPVGQSESAAALGLSKTQAMYRIIFPQAVRNMIPNLLGLYINEIKNSSLASVIAVNEILHRGNVLISNTFRPLEIYSTIALVYMVILLPLTYASKQVEIKFSAGRN